MRWRRARDRTVIRSSLCAGATLLVASCASSGSKTGFVADAGTGEAGNVDAAVDTGSTNAGDSGSFGADLIINPASAIKFIDLGTTPPTPAEVSYTATANNVVVTSQLALSIPEGPDGSSYGSFNGQKFTSTSDLPPNAQGLPIVDITVAGNAAGATGKAALTLAALHLEGPEKDFFFVEPYQQAPTPANDILAFSTKLQQVDVAILLDTTASMEGSITNIQTNLTKPGGILDGLHAAIPNVGIAICDHRDYPTSVYGTLMTAHDFPVKVWQVVTTDPALAQAAVANYVSDGGGDGPESQIPAMDYLLTGQSLSWPSIGGLPGGSVPTHAPAPGTAGGVDFRPGSAHVIAEMTDSSWHNYDGTPPDPGATPYVFSAPDYNKLVSDFAPLHAKYIGIVDDHGLGTGVSPHMESQALSDATGSNVPAAAYPGGTCNPAAGAAPNGNCRLNFDINNGTGLDTSIVQGIQAIATGSSNDVTAIAANDPNNANGVDATKFIASIRAMGEGSATNGCPPAQTRKSNPSLTYDDVFVGVTVGTPVCFEVTPAVNDTVKELPGHSQAFRAFINVVALPGDEKLDQRSVLFLVPPGPIGQTH